MYHRVSVLGVRVQWCDVVPVSCGVGVLCCGVPLLGFPFAVVSLLCDVPLLWCPCGVSVLWCQCAVVSMCCGVDVLWCRCAVDVLWWCAVVSMC